MTAHEYLAAFLTLGSIDNLGDRAASAEFRLALYEALGATQVSLSPPYHPLLRDLFERELRYRLSDDDEGPSVPT